MSLAGCSRRSAADERSGTSRWPSTSGSGVPDSSGPRSTRSSRAARRPRLPHATPDRAKVRAKATSWCWTSAASTTHTAWTLRGRFRSDGPATGPGRCYAAVLEAHDRAISAVAPGRSRFAIDAAARDALDRARAGRGVRTRNGARPRDRDPRRTPHHAAGRAMPPAGRRVGVAGMVFTIEPGAYLPAGVACESKTTCWSRSTASSCSRT